MRDQAEAGRLQDAEETAQLWEILCGVLDQFVEILGDEPWGWRSSADFCGRWPRSIA